MIFADSIVLENDRARLQPLAPADRELLWPLAQDPDIWTFMPKAGNERAHWDNYFDQALAAKEDRQRYPFLILDQVSGQPAGTTSYGNFSLYDRRVEIGWSWLGSSFRGTGLNQACKFLLLSFAFEKMDMLRVELKTDQRNARSRAAIMALGAIEEGVLRSHMRMQDGGRRDTVYYSILAEEWPNVRTVLLRKMEA